MLEGKREKSYATHLGALLKILVGGGKAAGLDTRPKLIVSGITNWRLKIGIVQTIFQTKLNIIMQKCGIDFV